MAWLFHLCIHADWYLKTEFHLSPLTSDTSVTIVAIRSPSQSTPLADEVKIYLQLGIMAAVSNTANQKQIQQIKKANTALPLPLAKPTTIIVESESNSISFGLS